MCCHIKNSYFLYFYAWLNLTVSFIQVAQTNKDEPIDRQAERKVTITGNPDAQWKVLEFFVCCVNVTLFLLY